MRQKLALLLALLGSLAYIVPASQDLGLRVDAGRLQGTWVEVRTDGYGFETDHLAPDPHGWHYWALPEQRWVAPAMRPGWGISFDGDQLTEWFEELDTYGEIRCRERSVVSYRLRAIRGHGILETTPNPANPAKTYSMRYQLDGDQLTLSYHSSNDVNILASRTEAETDDQYVRRVYKRYPS
jgi:hypothetical protein